MEVKVGAVSSGEYEEDVIMKSLCNTVTRRGGTGRRVRVNMSSSAPPTHAGTS